MIEPTLATEAAGSTGPGWTGRTRVIFTPSGREIRVPTGVTVFDAASWNGIAIDSTCGGHGTCRRCRVRVLGGGAPVSRLDIRAFGPEELREGWRLACRTVATGDLHVEVPPLTTRPKAATVGVGRQVILRPAVQKRYLELSPPCLADQTSDLDRILAAIDDLDLRVDLHALQAVRRVLRQSDYRVTAVVVDDLLVDVEAGDTTAERYAIAFDLGTTTVVATLLDTSTGTPVAVASMLNKQQPFGADVITRISAVMMDPTALPKLRQLAQETMNELARVVCTQAAVDQRRVYEVALAGNATMTHIVLGVDPEPLGVAPFVLATTTMPPVLASDLGVAVHPRAPAIIFPALGAYVGGDIVSGMLASGMDRDKRLRLLIDVGTNCEMALGDGERILATAAPAGPAFEGAAIRCGMRAVDGAVDQVRLEPGSEQPVTLGVIGDCTPHGLCGSGLVDAVAELVRIGLLDPSGRFVSSDQAAETLPDLAERLSSIDGERVFVLHPGQGRDQLGGAVFVTQRDVRELQFAKASIATGWSLLCGELRVDPADLAQVLLAGSFGSYLSPRSAIRIGLVPKIPVLRIVSAGNVASEGAKMILLSLRERAGVEALLRQVHYVELSDRADFNDRFVDQLAFPA